MSWSLFWQLMALTAWLALWVTVVGTAIKGAGKEKK